MRLIVIRLMLALAAFAVVPNALAADTGGSAFVDARFGETSIDRAGDDHSRTAWGADGGYLWSLDEARSLGFEVGYAHFGRVADFAGNSGSDRVSASAISLGGHFQYLFGDDRAWIFQLRGGLASVKFDDDFTSNFGPGGGTAGTDSSSETGVYAGLGIGRKITQGFSVILAYSYYGTTDSPTGTGLSLGWLGLAAEYQF